MNKRFDVIIADTIHPLPEQHEVEIAWILAKHFRCNVEFLQPQAGYKMKTPDIVMKGVMWEIKSPTGSSRKATIEYQFKGLKQSRNLIIDGRRTKLDDTFIVEQLEKEAKHHRTATILFIDKAQKVLEVISRK